MTSQPRRRPAGALAAAVAVALSVSVGGARAAAPPPAAAPAPAAARPWVTGYYAGWFPEAYPPAVVDMRAMTHFVFGRYAPGGGGQGLPGRVMEMSGNGHAHERDLVARAHAAGTRALAMLGGTGDGRGFDASTRDPHTRGELVTALLDLLVAKDYDGVDVNWEDALETPAQQEQLVSLLRELRAASRERERYRPPRELIITFPGSTVNTNYQKVQPWQVTVASLVDQYNVMTYGIGMAGEWEGWKTWHMSALQDARKEHPTSVASSVEAYVRAGVPASKLGIGIGFFGISFERPATGPRQPGPRINAGGSDVEWNWARLHKRGYLSSGTAVWDEAAQATYRSYGAGGWGPPGGAVSGYLSYEDERSIAAKAQWVRAHGVGGTILWTINYGCIDPRTGENPPLAAVKRAFLR